MTHLERYARITGPDRAELSRLIRERYAAGESIRVIAVGTGRSYGSVQRMLRGAGVLRARGGRIGVPRGAAPTVAPVLAQSPVDGQEPDAP